MNTDKEVMSIALQLKSALCSRIFDEINSEEYALQRCRLFEQYRRLTRPSLANSVNAQTLLRS